MKDGIGKCPKCGKPLWAADYSNRHLVCTCGPLSTAKLHSDGLVTECAAFISDYNKSRAGKT